jgi:hypothetical protein
MKFSHGGQKITDCKSLTAGKPYFHNQTLVTERQNQGNLITLLNLPG